MSVYREMLDDLDRHGWYQGDSYEDWDHVQTSPACLVGSRDRVIGTERYSARVKDVTTRMSALIRQRYPERMVSLQHPVTTFNDHKDTTEEDVKLLLKELDAEEEAS